LLGGCGGSGGEKPARDSSVKALAGFRAKDCRPAGAHDGVSYRLCWRPVGNQHGTFAQVKGGERTVLALSRPGSTQTSSCAGRSGHWEWAALSPDGTRFLAQWRGDCEAPTSFFLPLAGGKPVPVTAESDWLESPDSLAFGWTPDGRAIVFLSTSSACGGRVAIKPGLYLAGVNGRRRLLREAKEPPTPLRRSLGPRTASSLGALLGAD
jgi:hypothetical protein